MSLSEAPSSSRATANADGNEVSSTPRAGQSKPAPAIDLADTPSSHIRNVRLILEMAAEHSRNGLKLDDGTLVLDRWAVIDIERKLGAALAQLDAAQLAQTIADFTPGVVAIDPRDPAQLTLDDPRTQVTLIFDPFGRSIADTVPVQSRPAFASRCPNPDCHEGRIRGTAVGCAVCQSAPAFAGKAGAR